MINSVHYLCVLTLIHFGYVSLDHVKASLHFVETDRKFNFGHEVKSITEDLAWRKTIQKIRLNCCTTIWPQVDSQAMIDDRLTWLFIFLLLINAPSMKWFEISDEMLEDGEAGLEDGFGEWSFRVATAKRIFVKQGHNFSQLQRIGVFS